MYYQPKKLPTLGKTATNLDKPRAYYVPSSPVKKTAAPTAPASPTPTYQTQSAPAPAPATGRRTYRDVGRERYDMKLGQGRFDQFKAIHGVDPLEFYSDPRNWFPYQRDAAMDYGVNSRQFAEATMRAAIEEGMQHDQEVALWRQKHGDTPIPDEMWKHWYYINRYGNPNNEPIVW